MFGGHSPPYVTIQGRYKFSYYFASQRRVGCAHHKYYADLAGLKNDKTPSTYSEGHFLKWLLKHDLTIKEKSLQIRKDLSFNLGVSKNGVMQEICTWI